MTSTSNGVTYTNGLPCHLIVCNGTGASMQSTEYMTGTTVSRINGTVSEIFFDILVYVPKDRTLHFVRCGGGDDRSCVF